MEGIKTSESITKLAAALLEFHKSVPDIVKTRPGVYAKYANLGDVLSAIDKPLQDAKITYVQFPIDEYGLATRIIHIESGEWMESTYKMGQQDVNPQKAGAVVTYQRRYALGAILGLNIEKDDDAEGTSKQPTQQANQPVNQSDPFNL